LSLLRLPSFPPLSMDQEMEVDRSDDDQTPSTSSTDSSIGSSSTSLPLPPIDLRTFPALHLHLFAQQNTANWEEWLGWLATSLSPSEWRLFWESYAALFGVERLPLSLLPPPQLSPTPFQLATTQY
ncbi:hypothetical protein PMAYCL1PPCAC_23555, partial [Pristionchus mayeri]